MLSGCYLGHLAAGQWKLWRGQVDVQTLLSDPGLEPALRSRLQLVQAVLEDAHALGLEVDAHYQRYVDWPGDSIVTSLVSTRAGELEPVTSWFPIVGAVPYRGYFDPERADREAQRRRGAGQDVCEVKVRAYSTLGWFSDPLTGPMLRQPEAVLVETLFHELLHATVFASGEAAFNEGVASFLGQEARVQFYAAREGDASGLQQRSIVEGSRRLQAEIGALRSRIETLYEQSPESPDRLRERARLEAESRQRISALELPGRDPAQTAAQLQLGDACLALAGTYHADLPRWAVVLSALGGDLAAFVDRAKQAARSPQPRARLLAQSEEPTSG